MPKFKILIIVLCLMVVCCTQSGCALLQIPLALVQAPFYLLGQVIKLVSVLPKPPPGVFF